MQKSDHQCTVQAPHCANPQPKCMPCRPSWSRNAYSNGMLGSSTFKATAVPLTVSLMVVAMTPVNPSLRSQGMCGETGGDCRQRLVEYCSYRYAISAIRGETSILHGTSFGGLPALRVPNLHSHFAGFASVLEILSALSTRAFFDRVPVNVRGKAARKHSAKQSERVMRSHAADK